MYIVIQYCISLIRDEIFFAVKHVYLIPLIILLLSIWFVVKIV